MQTNRCRAQRFREQASGEHWRKDTSYIRAALLHESTVAAVMLAGIDHHICPVMSLAKTCSIAVAWHAGATEEG